MLNKHMKVLGGILAAGVFSALLAGCFGDTSSDQATDSPFDSGDEFVANESTVGKIELKCPDNIEVADTSSFSVTVTDVSGAPVPQIKISCDTEEALKIIDPTSGIAMTSGFGIMSGVVGCEAPGSFQLGCRLPIGGNKRKFCLIHCTGDIPAGFTGFDGAGGGGLGGGVDTPDDGTPGGTDIAGTNVVLLEVFDVTPGEGTRAIDIFQNPDCDGDPTTVDPEPFVQNEFKATIRNNSNKQVRVVSYTFTVSDVDGAGTGDYTSGNVAVNQVLEANGGEDDVMGVLTRFTDTGKAFVGRSTTIVDGFRNITFRFRLKDESGQEGTVVASVGLNFQAFDNCGS